MTSRKAQLGLNLVELMIGLLVGMIVLAAMTHVYLNASRGSRDTLNANRLNQDLRAVMDIMVADIRRAGYWGTAASGSNNPFTVRTSPATDFYLSNNCILYSYDATYNAGSVAGTPDAGVDFFGFRLSGGAVQMVQPGTGMNDTSVGCNTLTWQGLTDPAVINVSALTFSTGRPAAGEPGSKCVNANTGASWEVESTAVQTTPACACTNTGICSGYVAPTTGNRMAETRQITISITANHVSDTTLTRTLTESVLVRNNRLYSAP